MGPMSKRSKSETQVDPRFMQAPENPVYDPRFGGLKKGATLRAQPVQTPPGPLETYAPPHLDWAPPPPQLAHLTAAAKPDQTSGDAVASMVLGICGLVVLPLIPSIIAVLLGNRAKRDIRAHPQMRGAGMATAGLATAWVGIGICSLAVLVLMIVLAGQS